MPKLSLQKLVTIKELSSLLLKIGVISNSFFSKFFSLYKPSVVAKWIFPFKVSTLKALALSGILIISILFVSKE